MASGLLAIVGLIGVIVAKFVTTNRSQMLHQRIAEIQTENNKIRGELKLAGSTKSAAIHDLKVEERKLRTLKLKVQKYEKDLANLKK
ncbi:MAG: hypothetical protein QGG64_16475 [Candidatus Latescibacteria bacterium]|jgi:xanthosine utilization system XapX-like protein|nr:hypothetical protein [Candidatus Latescibacterota bacterium]